MNEAEAFESSRRTLAAIVFTDIADFHARMGAHEEHTLKLAQRDLNLIRKVCQKQGGRVLKGTGDGLLMYFDSAVQAVACALEAQQALAIEAKSLPPEDVLKHRIGIHLGDVFVSESDVMGDGVNIAARLQAEAEPGGVCISQTVYDVVKNRLAVQATYLGPRELKNIREAVPVYQILLDAQGVNRAPMKRKSAMSGLQWVMVGTVAAVVVLGVVLAIIVLRGGEKATVAVRSGGSATPAGPTTAEVAQREKIDTARRTYLAKGDYSGMLKWLEKNNLKDSDVYRRYQELKNIPTLLMAPLRGTTEASPIVVPLRKGSVQMWESADGGLNVKEGDEVKQEELKDIPPRLVARLLTTCAKQLPSSMAMKLNNAARILGEELKSINSDSDD